MSGANGGAGGLEVEVVVLAPAWRAALDDCEACCRRWARAAFAAAAAAPMQASEVAVVLADDARLAALNRTYRGIDGPTNVLAFPAGDVPPGMCAADAPRPLGDVIVAYETMRAEADAAGKPLADHLCHLVVHGILHLLGYDHQMEEEAQVMERRETAILASIGFADPHAGRDAGGDASDGESDDDA